MKQKYSPVLKEWMRESIEDNLWEKFHDLHMDEIDPGFKQKENWLCEALPIFSYLLTINKNEEFDIILAIPLTYKSSSSVCKINNLKDLQDELDLSPPSFYLFRKDSENFSKTINSAHYIATVVEKYEFKIFYMEIPEGDEFFRIVYVKSSV